MNAGSVLYVDNVSFAYPNQSTLFSEIKLELKSGERLAILGDNGTGKTTFLRLALGFLSPGTGVLIKSPKLILSYANINRTGLYGHLTGMENLLIWQSFSNIPSSQFKAALDSWRDCSLFQKALVRKTESLSTGMSSILALFRALNLVPTDQALICLDEPWAHLDQSAQVFITNRIRSAARQYSMLITGHYLSDNIHTVCSRALQIEGGRLVSCH